MENLISNKIEDRFLSRKTPLCGLSIVMDLLDILFPKPVI